MASGTELLGGHKSRISRGKENVRGHHEEVVAGIRTKIVGLLRLIKVDIEARSR
jgi:hypothetical protein